MADVKITGAGTILDTDYRYVKWVGKTKGGGALQIVLKNAICASNPDWSFAEKTEAVADVEFWGCYTDEQLLKDDRTEPWEMSGPAATDGKKQIQLGVGRFYVGTDEATAKYVGLTRGGGSFVVERNFREINADDDPGPVKDRMDIDEARPKLKFSALEWVDKVTNLYAGMKTVNA